MSNIVEIIIEKAVESVSANPWVAGGMVAGGVLIAIGGWVWRKRKDKK